jgi:hypothetical protein
MLLCGAVDSHDYVSVRELHKCKHCSVLADNYVDFARASLFLGRIASLFDALQEFQFCAALRQFTASVFPLVRCRPLIKLMPKS